MRWQRCARSVSRTGRTSGRPYCPAGSASAWGGGGGGGATPNWCGATSQGGQRQRVALARALVSQPHLLLLDEPLGALDALTRLEMQHLIERIWLEQRFTAVLVTHDVAEAVALSDRVIVLKDGRIASDHAIELPRPRERTGAQAAEIEAAILDELLS